MSRETNNATVSEEEKFQIGIEANEDFNAVAEQNIMTSVGLCRLFSKFFQVYDDFKGVRLDVAPNGNISVAAFFNHYEFPADAITAFSKDVTAGTATKNPSVDRLLRQKRLQEDGVKYYLTKEGREGLEDFVFAKNNRGKVDWNRCTADVTNPTSFGQNEVVSMISGIDPVKLLREIYGTKDEDGNEYDYTVRIISSKPPIMVGAAAEYTLSILRFNKKELDRSARDTGIAISNALGIVK